MLFFFFFQAEDGIRARNVTGVQTCALPICREPPSAGRSSPSLSGATARALRTRAACGWPRRSEERRVGKECRSRWSPYQEKKNGFIIRLTDTYTSAALCDTEQA